MYPDGKKAAVANAGGIPKVGYVYDVRMKHHFNLNEVEYPHPEDPRRIYWIYDILDRSGCLKIMRPVNIQPVTDTQILRAHSRSHLEFLNTTELMEKPSLIAAQAKYEDVYLCALSLYCARLSAGGLLALCNEVVRGNLHSGLAIIRPPGHHACQNKPMGFCLLNNIAIAIKDLQMCSPVQRILVVDWDIHHGNGIQDMFYSDPSVLYISLHRFDGDFFPHSNGADFTKLGKDRGKGYNINVPWTSEGVGDGDYLYAFRKLILPVAREFKPEMIIVACGFDAAACDPIGECNVTPECYATMTAMLKSVCPKLVLSLEGGYNLEAIANSALGCAKALLNIKWKAGLVPEAATVQEYMTLPEAEINGFPAEHQSFIPAWLASPKWSPAEQVSECFAAKPSVLGKDVVDRVIREVGPYWQCL
ncbi:Histone deacetylase hda1 [Coemansia aciculifera]|uniref:histone deacetylase n=2 Tax=Coemansia TaxID=4863 RepID=A0A9W8GSH6_9FUNG|nr:Histone deacetylase hda1 [Coemansia pectinata]KAJ2865404.1 Histone deacetylase hda1 [Coemansia aciculifera]KAJ2885690.1 Histone deacetylase hda1 [Coemansia aciculifera]